MATSTGAVGSLMFCTTRIPARTNVLARSVAPVKSSAMQPSLSVKAVTQAGGSRDVRR